MMLFCYQQKSQETFSFSLQKLTQKVDSTFSLFVKSFIVGFEVYDESMIFAPTGGLVLYDVI